MHNFSRFSCLCSGSKDLLFTEARVKITDVILPAGVNACLWVSWCVHRCLWVFVGVYECLWVPMGAYECLWVFLDVYEFLWVSRGFCWSMGICGCHRYLWQFMGIYGCLWVFMGFYECLWVSGCFLGCGFWVCMVQHILCVFDIIFCLTILSNFTKN